MKVEETENIKIARFLSATSDFIKEIVRKTLMMAGCKIAEQRNALNLCYEIKYKDNKACLFFRNLYLEIATKDRDAEPLEFDEKLYDFAYFITKTMHMIHYKIKMLLDLLKSDNTDSAIEKILRESNCSRLFIRKFK